MGAFYITWDYEREKIRARETVGRFSSKNYIFSSSDHSHIYLLRSSLCGF